MAQLENLSLEGCEADLDWVETWLTSAENSAFSKCEQSFWGAFTYLEIKGGYLRQYFCTFIEILRGSSFICQVNNSLKVRENGPIS